MVFTQILKVTLPDYVIMGKGFTIRFEADAEIPFAQVIVRHADGWEWIVRDEHVKKGREMGRYRVEVPPKAYHGGTAYLQIEGCRKADIGRAGAADWVTIHKEIEVREGKPHKAQSVKKAVLKPKKPTVTLGTSNEPLIYFGIHKHMHQPYYNATDLDYWDGEKDGIFGERGGPYTHFIPAAVQQYIDGGLAHAGLSTSWSGSLIEQLNRCAETGRGHGAFGNWNAQLRDVAQQKTAFGNPRVDFTAFGHFHPIMSLIPARDIIGQIAWHKTIIRDTFGTEAGDVIFPPETAFAPHMIPALKQAGIKAVIFDSIHHFRACQEYPYAGADEGMLPPSRADQINPPVNDWLQLQNIWAASKISPQLLKPCILYYEDHTGQQHDIIGVPAERYLGNEDARGGYGALLYESVMGQILDHIVATGTYDPDHPPFFLLHSDGDNYGGGADSYYTCNTGRLVEMCKHDRRFQLITIEDYLHQFPVDPKNRVHVEPGAWAGADNGDPQFTKWFSRAEQEYSPDLNSWAVLTAFQNVVYSLEDAGENATLVNNLKRLLYTAETSCYWYWTGQHVWDSQVTNAANTGMALAKDALQRLTESGRDATGPTMFIPWVRPANPGGKTWGQGGLTDAPSDATFRTFGHDISGIKSVTLHYHNLENGKKQGIGMKRVGTYPSFTNPTVTGTQYTIVLPKGTGSIRYYIEAVDQRGNTSFSPVGRIHIA